MCVCVCVLGVIRLWMAGSNWSPDSQSEFSEFAFSPGEERRALAPPRITHRDHTLRSRGWFSRWSATQQHSLCKMRNPLILPQEEFPGSSRWSSHVFIHLENILTSYLLLELKNVLAAAKNSPNEPSSTADNDTGHGSGSKWETLSIIP